jgi:hypothetical protein
MDALVLALIIAAFVLAVMMAAFIAVAKLLATPPEQGSVYCMELALHGQYNSSVGPCAVYGSTVYYVVPGH